MLAVASNYDFLAYKFTEAFENIDSGENNSDGMHGGVDAPVAVT